MESGKAGSILIVIGIVSGIIGLFLHDLFWSSLLYVTTVNVQYKKGNIYAILRIFSM